ncbi:Cmx/CmrA family chloramphenicol efflux MFS transporter [Streptomyces hygroscopicus]|uniref:Cmx/CmrA family chloramphenicol efflux MFS transporter n=1 Tax=Streptomyces sp. KHY 26 TaxID=3097359 RepID=UPI00255738BC|nr:Cmx/CmrA family chloramphenicol efflux MFS transporter [Streptomyces hygroscopicus]
MPLALHLLALAAFAMGTSEFMLAGLVPEIAADLGVTVGTAGLLTSAFALGMVVGAPLMAALARNRPGRAALSGFVLLFAATHAVGATATGFPVLCATRVVAALANAGFLAVALTTAAALVPPDRKGRALAVLLSGTTVAVIAGVPAGSVLGTLLGWRATFWAVAALCLPAAVGVLTGVPARRPEKNTAGGLRAELAQLRRPRLLLAMLLGALVNAATFAAFTFLAPVVTGTAGLGELWIPVALVLFGAGSFAGVGVAGRLSDRRPGVVVAAGGPLLLVGWPALAVLAHRPVALLTLVFVQGALSFAVGGVLITRVLYEAAHAPTMAGSYATAALNIGAATGPLVAAATLAGSELGPLWAGGALVAAALPVAVVFRAVPGTD